MRNQDYVGARQGRDESRPYEGIGAALRRGSIHRTLLVFRTKSILPLFAALSLLGCAKSEPPTDADKATPVRIAAATLGPAAPSILATGVIANKDEVQLSFKIGGVIKRIYVEQGASVKRDQKLAEVEPVEIDAQVTQAQQLADKAQRELQRGERLYADQVIALEQLEALRTQLAVAKAQLQAAQFNHRYAVITAPDDGSVLRKLAEEHQVIAQGQPVLIVGTKDRGYVARAALADREVVQLKLGDAVQVQLDAFPGQSLEGKVSEIAKAALAQNGLFPVEVALSDAPASLASGLVARLAIEPSTAHQQPLVYVPIAAILQGDKNKASVFVLQGEQAKKREVNVAFIDNDRVALRGGVQAGEQVVTDGALYLDDGERVSIAQQEPAS